MKKDSLINLLITSLFFVFAVSCNNKNIVEGNIGYPSDYVPEVEVVLENVADRSQLRLLVEASYDGESSYSFRDVPDGKYIVFAIPTESDIDMLVGGYTNAVPCGLSVDCTDHGFIELDVKGGISLKDVNIYDWYTDDVVIKENREFTL